MYEIALDFRRRSCVKARPCVLYCSTVTVIFASQPWIPVDAYRELVRTEELQHLLPGVLRQLLHAILDEPIQSRAWRESRFAPLSV
jgi:hypothetical protein